MGLTPTQSYLEGGPVIGVGRTATFERKETSESATIIMNARNRVVPAERLCEECDLPIPAKRLAAIPEAALCVRCTERRGDVVRIKRHDDYVGKDGDEVVSTYYTTPDPYLQTAITRRKSVGSFMTGLKMLELHEGPTAIDSVSLDLPEGLTDDDVKALATTK